MNKNQIIILGIVILLGILIVYIGYFIVNKIISSKKNNKFNNKFDNMIEEKDITESLFIERKNTEEKKNQFINNEPDINHTIVDKTAIKPTINPFGIPSLEEKEKNENNKYFN